jgi:hypothetical protein
MELPVGLIAFLLLLAWGMWGWGGLPKPFRGRACQGKDWRKAFPNASKEEIREFLQIFVDAFAFKEKERLKFRPGDMILDVYRALYPHKWMADSLEVETFAEDLLRRYGVELHAVWKEDLTLGELFFACRARNAQQGA